MTSTNSELEATNQRHRRRAVVLVVAVLALLASACQYDPAKISGNPAFSECEGEPATIGIGYNANRDGPNGSTYYGTEGRDVVVITNGPVTFHAGGGDDLICINDTGMAWGDGYGSVFMGLTDYACGTIAIVTGRGADIVHDNSSHTALDQGQSSSCGWASDVVAVFGPSNPPGYGTPSPYDDGEDTFFGGPARERVWLWEGDGSHISTAGGDDLVGVIGQSAELVDCGRGQDSAWSGTNPVADQIIDCETVS